MTNPEPLKLVGIAEVSLMLGLSRQRADAITRKPSFPAPVGSLAAGRVWFEEEVRAWAEAQGRQVAQP